jgi:esterase/lipase superfamily enzyme
MISRSQTALRQFLAFALLLSLSACGSSGPYSIAFMPAPDIYAEEIVDPFADFDPIEIADGDAGMIYITNRERVDDTEVGAAYSSDRGYVLRAGVARVKLGEGDFTWEEARQVSLLKNRTEDYPIQVAEVTEFGVLPESITALQEPAEWNPDPAATDEMVRRVQAHLDRSRVKEITIYVHGYKVTFDNPVLVSAELWHYLGYEGSFIAFSWPATPKTLAYFKDSASAAFSGAHLRRLLTTLADRTTAEQINIIGYSAGTRVVVNALDQLNLLARFAPESLKRQYLRIGDVMLVGADADRDNFARMLSEDVLGIVESFNIYVSGKDKALGFSNWLFGGQNRLGQMVDLATTREGARRFLARNPKLRLINVTEAEDSEAASGHGYFRQSPWVSGDILMTLRHDLSPARRGLVLNDEGPVWDFPSDYLLRMRMALADLSLPPRSAAAGNPEP